MTFEANNWQIQIILHSEEDVNLADNSKYSCNIKNHKYDVVSEKQAWELDAP